MQLIPLGPNVFEEATVDSVVYILKKAKESNNLIDVKTPSEPKEIYNTKSKQSNNQGSLIMMGLFLIIY